MNNNGRNEDISNDEKNIVDFLSLERNIEKGGRNEEKERESRTKEKGMLKNEMK